MKRDMDVVRHILLATEASSGGGIDSSSLATSEWDAEVVGYHADILLEAGLLDGEVVTYCGSAYPDVFIRRLTWDGHDFLDAVRDETVWNRTKATLVGTAGTAALEVVKAVAVSIARSSLGLGPT